MAQPYRKTKPSGPGPEQQVIESVFKAIGWLLKSLFGGKKSSFNNAKFQEIASHWMSVEQHLVQESTRALAVSEADKLLDSAFQAAGIPGSTMGERLKAAEKHFSRELYNQLWNAHKLRNNLAHEIGAHVSAGEAQIAVRTFQEALQKLGVGV